MSADSVTANIARFNAEAASWDSNVVHRHTCERACREIVNKVPGLREYHDGVSSNGFNVLEIGSGTGLLSLMMAPYVGTLIGVDTSSGMVDAFQAKISQLQEFKDPSGSKLATVCMLLEDPDDPKFQEVARRLHRKEDTPVRFDLIVSHLTLHHVPSLDAVLKMMMKCLKPGGRVALTDFEDFGEDAVLFHHASKRHGVERHGIKRSEMEKKMVEAGYVNIMVETAFAMNKDVERAPGKIEAMEFPFLICQGQRPLDA